MMFKVTYPKTTGIGVVYFDMSNFEITCNVPLPAGLIADDIIGVYRRRLICGEPTNVFIVKDKFIVSSVDDD